MTANSPSGGISSSVPSISKRSRLTLCARRGHCSRERQTPGQRRVASQSTRATRPARAAAAASGAWPAEGSAGGGTKEVPPRSAPATRSAGAAAAVLRERDTLPLDGSASQRSSVTLCARRSVGQSVRQAHSKRPDRLRQPWASAPLPQAQSQAPGHRRGAQAGPPGPEEGAGKCCAASACACMPHCITCRHAHK